MVPEEVVTRATDRRSMHWWQDWKWIAALAALLAVVAFSAFVYNSVRTGQTVDDQKPILEQLTDIAETNRGINEQNQDTLDRLQKNQAGIDELVAFVHEVQAQQSAQGQGQSQVVKDIITILCSSSDPVRLAACERLGYSGG